MAGGKSGAAAIFNSDTAMLLLRLALAAVFVFHGGQKMIGWFGGRGWDKSVAGFVAMGLPEWLAMFTIITEFVGGCCIAFGLLARFWAAGTAIVMASAIAMVHIHDGWDQASGKWLDFQSLWSGNTEQGTRGIEFLVVVLLVSLAVFFGGPGRWAIADLEGWLLGIGRKSGKSARGGDE